MQHARTVLPLAFCLLISACNTPDAVLASGAITLNDDLVTLHVSGTPDASINANGDLQIADKLVMVNPAQRGLLMLYYQNVHDVSHTGREMGKVGTKIGSKAFKDKVQGKSKSDQDQDAQAGAQQLKELSQKMCQDQVNIKGVQEQLSAQLAEFKPYGNIMNQDEIKECLKDNKDD